MSQADLAKEFVDYFKANPDTWVAYVKFTHQAAQKNVRLSIGMISERIRWESMVLGSGNYKVQNSFRAFYARLLAYRYPVYAGRFSLKKIDIDGNADLKKPLTWNHKYWSQF